MKSDRLLALLLILQARGRASARALADELEVSERTIYRDMESLSAAGVPVYTEQGRHGGCVLLEGYKTDVSGLSTDEARALFAFAGRGAPVGPGLESDLQGALRKLLAALPAPQRPEVAAARGRVVVDSVGWRREADATPWLDVVQGAVWSDRRLLLRYRHADADEADEIELNPYGLVAKAGIWYLIGAPGAVAGPPPAARMYRVSRIESATRLDVPALRPADLDLETLWSQLRRQVERRPRPVAVTARVKRSVAPRLLRMVASSLHGSPQRQADDERPDCEVMVLPFVAPSAAQGLLLAFGTEVEVLDPPAIRAAVAAEAARVVALYAATADEPTTAGAGSETAVGHPGHGVATVGQV
jgi:predicted DNA-binding transcriptional regulator YafY